MNISRKWLSEFVDIQATDKEYDDVMTMAGQKVETTTRMDAEIRNVVVGKVLSMVRHENSDHMWVCMVDVGAQEPVQIVTGAQNVSVGDLVPTALHNSYLPGGVHITKGKLRGVLSCGMLCSFGELGLTQNDLPGAYADGIWILNDEDCHVGQDINQVIGNDDSIVEFEITNNRPDCYSLLGLARETAAAFNVPMKHHEPVVKGGADGNLTDLLDVEVPADDLCRRYSARMVKNVRIAPSPKWLRQRLRSAGIRPINNIVDITNYVMVEYGQPRLRSSAICHRAMGWSASTPASSTSARNSAVPCALQASRISSSSLSTAMHRIKFSSSSFVRSVLILSVQNFRMASRPGNSSGGTGSFPMSARPHTS